MILPIIGLAAVVIGLVRGGRIDGLSRAGFRGGAIMLILFFAQLLVRQVLPSLGILSSRALIWSWCVLAACLIAVCLVNWRIFGIPLLALGIVLNIVVVGLNSGMPVGGSLADTLGMSPGSGSMIEGGGFYRPVDSSTLAPALADVIPIPAPRPLRSLVSIGDVLMLLATGLLIEEAISRDRYRPRHSLDSHRI